MSSPLLRKLRYRIKPEVDKKHFYDIKFSFFDPDQQWISSDLAHVVIFSLYS